MDNVTLNNGVKMPMQGFGVFQIPDSTKCERVVVEPRFISGSIEDVKMKN